MEAISLLTVDIDIDGRVLEGRAAAVVYPGYLVERRIPDLRIVPHATVTGFAPPAIVLENRNAGKTFFDPYAIGDTVYMRYCLPGDVFIGICDNQDSIPPGTFVVSAGDGRLTVAPSSAYDCAVVGMLLTECRGQWEEDPWPWVQVEAV